jgi:hypothetical protein
MKNCSLRPTQHNLNIQMYSFPELLQLFELNDATEITTEKLKRAKMMVLKTHPDKSRLPPEYFLFYKKAFEIVVEFYNNQQKTTQAIPKTTPKYDTENIAHTDTHNDKITATIQSMKPKNFQKTFNELFEKNQMGKQIVNKNEWFSAENNQQLSGLEGEVKNASSLNSTIEKFKEKQHGMTVYNGVRELPISSTIECGNLYDDDEDVNDTTYIETDPFSRLKFEDIKKVHKNETVFSVGEKDYNQIPKYASVEQYTVARKIEETPLYDERESRRILKEKETEFQNKMLLREYEAKKKLMVNETKNKSILSYFLQIE